MDVPRGRASGTLALVAAVTGVASFFEALLIPDSTRPRRLIFVIGVSASSGS